ncbi:isochorismatase family protein [Bradyrhizobium diazoefficiens]|nr:isochorismatase family protein [Bradyrhizobium diazoefficiens]MBR0849133.1 isochorismatase family protein [Bradyrhizobium diazoefficiens]
MTHATLRSEFETLIDPYAPVAQIGTGFDFTEGPIWHPVDQHLLFSDMPGDVRRRWDARRGVVEVKRPSNKCNGMTYDAELNLIVCEHATSSLVRERPDGRREVLASHFQGQELNSPNDVCVHSSGAIYFSDPWYGRMPVYGVERPRQLGFQGVYRVVPGGEPKLVVDRNMFDQPNGLCFSPDERQLYVNDTVQALIRVFDVGTDGSLANPRVFASGIRSELEAGLPDGMKCDQHGNIWVTAPGGVWVYSPKAELLGKVRVPEMVANLTWGGPDFRTLYLTSTRSVYAIPTRTGPRHEPYMSGRRGSGGTASAGTAATAPILADGEMRLDPSRCAMIIQDLQNDVIMDGGAFAESGAPGHAKQQHVVENVRRLAETARARGVAIIHVWFIVEPGAPGVTLNAPLFEGLVDSKAMVRGSWGAAPVSGLEPRPGDFVVEKMRMSAWEGTRLETILKATGRDMIINTGAWTNMSVEHTARTGADKGYFMIVPEDCCSTMNGDWHNASINFAMQNVAVVTRADAVIRALG